MGNGTITTYNYNNKNFRLTNLKTVRGSDILQNISYIYDPEGNITETEDLAQQTIYFNGSVIEPKSTYEYDALYRLKKATSREHNSLANLTNNDFVNNIIRPEDGQNMRNFTQEYKYDQIGNLLQMKSNGVWTRDYKYNFATNNHLLKHDENATINSYEYDAHGNTTKMPHLQELKYDYADQLNEVTLNLDGNKAYYIYNAEGERVRKIIEKGNIIEERFYLGEYEIYSKKTNGTLDVERETLHINDDTKKIALIETKTGESAVIRYQYDNHLGSASLELDDNAEIISYEEYHPFGTTSYRSGRSETEVSLKRYKYVGKERDEETGLYYYGARYYSAWLCRFVSVDPLASNAPAWTPYNAMWNNPILNVDPDGRWAGEYDVVTNDDGTTTKTKISTLGDDQGVDFLHYRDGENKGTTEIIYNGSSVAWMNSSKNIRGYTLRNDDVNYADVTSEFMEGFGPEKSMFFETHPMVKDIHLSYVADVARLDFTSKGGDKKTGGNSGFGGHLTIMRAGVNITEQMIGRANYSVYPLGDDKAMMMVFDSKSRRSLYYHLPFVETYERGSRTYIIPGTWIYNDKKANTYQTYIWIESAKTIQQRIEQYDIENGPID